MLDTTADSWYTWVGLGVASVVLLSVVLGLPTDAPPTARHVATTVDGVADSPYEERATVALKTEQLRLGSHRVAVRSPGGTGHATFAQPVTPAGDGPLGRVLDTGRPRRAFDSPAALERAAARARKPGTWRPAPSTLTARRVVWGEVNVTLVG